MNYEKHYYALINMRKSKLLLKSEKFGDIETHHIIPKSLGGSDNSDNLINLTTREHYVAHWLLYKMLPKCHEMTVAFKLMSDLKHNQRRITSRVYANLKEKMSEIISNRMKNYYKNLSPDDYVKMQASHSQVMKNYWKNMSKELYDYWCMQHSLDIKNIAPEKMHKRNTIWMDKLNNKSEEEKDRIKALKRQGSIKRWNNMSDEDRKKFGDKFRGDNNAMRKMSDSDKLKFSLKIKEKLSVWRNNLSDEEKQKRYEIQVETSKRLQQWWKNRTDEELKQFSQKMSNIQQNMSKEAIERRSLKLSAASKKYWNGLDNEQRSKRGNKISESKKHHFTPEEDEYIKTHTIKDSIKFCGLKSAKAILKRRKELNISKYK